MGEKGKDKKNPNLKFHLPASSSELQICLKQNQQRNTQRESDPITFTFSGGDETASQVLIRFPKRCFDASSAGFDSFREEDHDAIFDVMEQGELGFLRLHTFTRVRILIKKMCWSVCRLIFDILRCY